MVTILRSDLDVANEYKEKFRVSSVRLDELLKDQRDIGDTRGPGFEHGESSSIANKGNLPENWNLKSLVRKPNAHKFNGTFFFCNKFGHRASKCRNRENQNHNAVLSQCSNCKKYGHRKEDYRMNVRCHAYGKFGYMANQCRSKKGQGLNKAI